MTDKAEDESGLTPGEDDNEGWRKSCQQISSIFCRMHHYYSFGRTVIWGIRLEAMES